MQLKSVAIQDEPLDMDDEPPPSEMLSAASTVSSSLHSSVSSSLPDEPPLSEISEHSTGPASLQTDRLRDTVMHTQSVFSHAASLLFQHVCPAGHYQPCICYTMCYTCDSEPLWISRQWCQFTFTPRAPSGLPPPPFLARSHLYTRTADAGENVHVADQKVSGEQAVQPHKN